MPARSSFWRRAALAAAAVAVAAVSVSLGGCDAGVVGAALDNQAPETALAYRDDSLVDNLDDALASTVFVSWTGTDADGFVEAFEIRFYPETEAASEWRRTTRNDTLVLLPIPRGQATANVVFEARAIDDDGAVDETPARTVFPIRNSPPSLRLNSFDLPPDTTWPAFSLSWTADDPEGEDNLAAIEVSLNDSLNFVALPADATFLTVVARETGAGVSETAAELFLGRDFVATGLALPGLRLDADNVVYVRAVDATDTTSVLQRIPSGNDGTFYVRNPTSNVLLVNDVTAAAQRSMAFHRRVLDERFGEGGYDTWALKRDESGGFPSNPMPTLERILEFWDRLYWVSNDGLETGGSNLAVAVGVSAEFFAEGGRLFAQVAPRVGQGDAANPALDVLPVDRIVPLPDSLQAQNATLNLRPDSLLTTVEPLPAGLEALPPLRVDKFVSSVDPVAVAGGAVPLYRAGFYYRIAGVNTAWSTLGLPAFVATISQDRRTALWSIPPLQDDGDPQLTGLDTDAPDPLAPVRDAFGQILDALDF